MTSIIGYTRVPFINSSASKHFTIAPVKQLYPNKPALPPTHPLDNDQKNPNNIRNSCGENDDKTRGPSYHRIFLREMSQHGIIELIIDKKQQQQQQQQSPLCDTTNRTITTQDNSKKDKSISAPPPSLISRRYSSSRSNNYKIFLSIDLSGSHDYDNLSVMNDGARYDNLQRLMDSISKIAQEKTIHFVNILNLLKKLQLQQEQHRFMSCIDKYREMILIYFPNTISSSSVDQTYNWLKLTIGIDVNKFKQWKLSPVEEEEEDLEQNTTSMTITNTNTTTRNNNTEEEDLFDGESYFNDLHMFIAHVDSLIESNGLFSHQKKMRTNYMN
jgi:hypothetical protein